jgi:hypothetical protein
VPVFVQNEALFEKIVALFEKNEATFGKQLTTLLQSIDSYWHKIIVSP